VRIAEANRRLDQGGRLSTGVKDFFSGICRAGAFRALAGLWRRGFPAVRVTEIPYFPGAGSREAIQWQLMTFSMRSCGV
jgi:hypothetical protein